MSFSEYVERTTFKTSQTVSSMRSTLKSKRRRARKREQKQAARQLRRRRSSSGSEVSSDERGSSSGSHHKAASTRKGSDDGVSSELTTESESRDTDDHPSDDDASGDEECFEGDAASGAADDVKLEADMKDLNLTEATTKDTDSVTQKRVHLEVTTGPVTEISCGPSAADSSGPPAADSNGPPAADSSEAPAVDSSEAPAADRSEAPAADSSVVLSSDSPGENYLNGDTGGMLNNIVKDNTESGEMGGNDVPGTGENPVGEGKKVELIQEVGGRDGKVNGEVTVAGEGEEESSGSKNKDTPETMLSWEDTPVVNDPVDSPVTFSNSLMYDLDDDD